MDCNEFIRNENTYEFIHSLDQVNPFKIVPECIQQLGINYEILYFDGEKLPPLSIEDYTYMAIPKCYGLMNLTSLEVSGITTLQNLPTLSLNGQGVLIAVIDTGINYLDQAFRNSDGSTRIYSIWDQNEGKTAPEGLLYGREYTREQINEAIRSENPLEIVPQQDVNGHGTALASIAAGSKDLSNEFTGAAPLSELLVVKLRPAKSYLRDFYFIPEQAEAYSEADIMASLYYVNQVAEKRNLPLVICLGLGSNNGGRNGTGPLCEMLNNLAALRHRAVVLAAGNEANARHHYWGRVESTLTPTRVEINVEQDIKGFYAELWALAPERFSVSVQSPTGEVLSKTIPINGESQKITFLFEGTTLTVDYRDTDRFGQNLLIFLRFSNAVKGIWTVRVYPDMAITGNFNIWLPISNLLMGNVYFLEPNPNTTLTTPSDSAIPITSGGYDAETGAIYLDSGRGFNAGGIINPDFLAPAVGITAKGLRNNYITVTGTSAAAAITAGACAQILDWAVTQQNSVGINSVDIKNLLIRGARRDSNQEYPSRESGYGKLDVYQAMENLRRK